MTPQEIIQAIDNARRTEGFDPDRWVFKVSRDERRELLGYLQTQELVSSDLMLGINEAFVFETFVFRVKVEAS